MQAQLLFAVAMAKQVMLRQALLIDSFCIMLLTVQFLQSVKPDHVSLPKQMTTLNELIKQREAIEAQIEAARKAENADAIAKVKALVAEHGLTAQDIFGGAKRGAKAGARAAVAPKYRDPATGATWTGRGKAPKWIDGKDRAQFAI
jgi:DNA-binding protein H-NS